MPAESVDEWTTVEVDVRDTAAYRIIRQITDHTWGSDSELSDSDIVGICRSFSFSGGSWEALMGGDMKSVGILEHCIDGLVGPRKVALLGSSVPCAGR